VHKYYIIYTITSIRTQDTTHDTGTHIQLSTNTHDHIHKYITNPNTVQARRCEKNTRLNHKSRGKRQGLWDATRVNTDCKNERTIKELRNYRVACG